ncbi:MAG: NmrA family NAD(P)-binding protein [Prolixibacteraceae bacterium]|nr:NmrA family NAD(P)-binding protein [Prolixibacteraceae bacterium]
MQNRILITGATGNVGVEVIRFLSKMDTSHQVIAGVRDQQKAKQMFSAYPNLKFADFDFENPATFDTALSGIDSIFLLRPPHISDVGKYFSPLIESLKKQQVRQMVFLSVQGAEKSKIIPHNKIERLIVASGLNYIFIRPSYFMQNLTTTLISDIKTKREIILPAGNAKFNWIDIENIGEVAAILLHNFNDYKNNPYELTGYENENFATVVKLINTVTESPVKYRSLNPLKFYNIKKRDGMKKGMIMVMVMLHFLPRFQKQPTISKFYEQLTGKQPTSLKAFINREKATFKEHFVIVRSMDY